MSSYRIRQEIFEFIRNDLLANPISDEYVTLSKFYKNLESKPKNVKNFLSIKKNDLPSKFGLNCKEINLLFIVNVYMENEVLADKFASLFVERYENVRVNSLRIQECEPINDTVLLEQNMVLKQIQFKVVK